MSKKQNLVAHGFVLAWLLGALAARAMFLSPTDRTPAPRTADVVVAAR